MTSVDNIIGIASDHAGFVLKRNISKYLVSRGFSVVDYGTYSEDSCDYTDFAHPLAADINSGKIVRGITICGSGNGISMVVNKYPQARAALCWNVEIAKLARSHNDANVCSIPVRFVSEEDAMLILESFLSTPFEGGRHIARVNKIAISNKQI